MKSILTKHAKSALFVLALVSSLTALAQEKVEIREGQLFLDDKSLSLGDFKSILIKNELPVININRAIKCDKHIKYYYGYGMKKVVITTIDGLVTLVGGYLLSDWDPAPFVYIITPAAAYHGYRTIKSFHTKEYWKLEKIKAMEGALVDYEIRHIWSH